MNDVAVEVPTTNVDEAKIPPKELMENRLFNKESSILNRFAVCPVEARINKGMEDVVVASTVTRAFETGVVVPNDDWPTPLTAPAIWAKTAEEICCLGERVSNVASSEEASTWR